MKVSRLAAAALGAAALGLLGRAAPAAPQASHLHPAVTTADTAGPAVRGGVSLNTPARSGRLQNAPLVPRTGGFELPSLAPLLASADPWSPAGPSQIAGDSGTIGGIPQAASGRVAALAADPTDPNTFYVASAGGGVWKTTDGGASYTALTDFLGDTAMGSIVVSPSNPQVIYAGTGEPDFSGDCKYGIGLLKSTDGGASWAVIPGPQAAFVRKSVSKVVVDPTNPNTVYLTLASAVNQVGGNRGVWKSTDGGASWVNTSLSASAVAAGMTSINQYTALVIDPKSPQTLYAAIGSTSGPRANGVYKTTDGGTTWAKLTNGLPIRANGDPVSQTALAISASSPNVVYASISNLNSTLLGLYKTVDGGATWLKLSAAPNYLGGQGFYDNAIAVSPADPNTLYAAGQVNYGANFYTELSALVGTHDGGVTFQDYSVGAGYIGPHTDTHALAYTAGGKLLDGNDGGVWRLENPTLATPVSQDAGDVSNIQWSDLNSNLATVQFTGVALHPTDPGIAYGGAQDNGTSKRTNGGLVWNAVRGGDGGYVRVDQSHPDTVYHTYYGISLERSDDGGRTWKDATTGINQSDPVPGGPSYADDPSSFYIPYQLDPLNQSRVIVGTDHVYQSVSRGDQFTAIGTPGVGGFNASGEVVYSLAIVGRRIYASVGDPLQNGAGALYLTVNGGGTWTDVSVPGIENLISDIFVNPANYKDVYVTRPKFDDTASGKVFHSADGGATWQNVSGNLPNIPFNAIKVDTAANVIYAGGDDGVYSSTNGGSSWARIGGGLPNVQVVSLDLNAKTGLLAVGTHGRGMWTLPLIKPTSAR